MDYIFLPIGNFFQWIFGAMEALGNSPNTIFIIGGFLGLIYWCVLQGKYNKYAEKTPGQLK